MINLRNIRHEILDDIDKSKKNKEIGEDDAKRLSSKIEQYMNEAKAKADQVSKDKEAEILTL